MLSVINGIIELGNDLKYGQTYKFSYQLKNISNMDVHIQRVYVGCTACTTTSVTSPHVKPGEETEIKVEFTPGSTGLQNKSVSLSYSANNVPQKDILMKFKGFVK